MFENLMSYASLFSFFLFFFGKNDFIQSDSKEVKTRGVKVSWPGSFGPASGGLKPAHFLYGPVF